MSRDRSGASSRSSESGTKRGEVERAGREELGQLLKRARIADFVPIFAYRFTKERLLEAERASPDEQHATGAVA